MANALVRALGLVQRVWMARFLGPEGLGLYQMIIPTLSALSVVVTTGLPVVANRRMAAARGRGGNAQSIRAAAMQLGTLLSAALCIGLLALCLPLATFVFDQPGLWMAMAIYAPTLILQALAALESAWCYANGDTKTPASALLLEQATRVGLLGLCLLFFLPQVSVWRAAATIACLVCAEALALGFVRHRSRQKHPRQPHPAPRGEKRAMAGEAALPTVGRFAASLLQALLALAVPVLLVRGGMSRIAAVSALGQMTGIVSPMLMIPLIAASAIGTVLVPEMARCNARGQVTRMRSLGTKARLGAVASALAAGAALYALARPACGLFGQPQAANLLRLCLPLLPPCALHSVQNAMLQGLGKQGVALGSMLAADVVYLGIALGLTGHIALPMGGLIIGQIVSECLVCLLQHLALRKVLRR